MKKLKGVSYREVILTEYPEWSYAVPGLLVHGLTLLAAKEGMGKSFLVQNIALGVANGGYVLGKIPVDKKDVLYLALEDGYRRIQRRGKLMLKDSEAPKNITIALEMEPLNGKDSGGVEQIQLFLNDNPDTGLVIIDTLAKVMEYRNGLDLRQETYRMLGPLQKLALDYQVSIVGVHHLKKGKAGEDPHDQIYGSAGYAQAADTVMMLDRVRNENTAKLTVSGRDLEPIEYALKWSPDILTWSIVGDATSTNTVTRPERARDKVLRILENLPECKDMRATDIYDVMENEHGMSSNTTKSALSELIDARLIDTAYYKTTRRYRVPRNVECEAA